MTTDRPQPEPPPKRTMCRELIERLKDPIFEQIFSTNGAGCVITGVRQAPPAAAQVQAPAADERPDP